VADDKNISANPVRRQGQGLRRGKGPEGGYKALMSKNAPITNYNSDIITALCGGTLTPTGPLWGGRGPVHIYSAALVSGKTDQCQAKVRRTRRNRQFC